MNGPWITLQFIPKSHVKCLHDEWSLRQIAPQSTIGKLRLIAEKKLRNNYAYYEEEGQCKDSDQHFNIGNNYKL